MWSLLPLVQLALGADLMVGPGQPYASVRDAVNAASTGDRILVDPGTYDESLIQVNSNVVLTIEAAAGPHTATVRMVIGNIGLLDLKNGAEVTWIGIDVEGLGVGRFADGRNVTLTVQDASITDVIAPFGGTGAAVQALTSTVAIVNCDLAGRAGTNGGLIAATDSVLTVTDTIIRSGSATAGGGIQADGASTVTVTGGSFLFNSATTGSAIDALDSDLTVTGALISGNSATDGAIRCVNGTTCAVSGCWFDGTNADSGGVVHATGTATTTLTDLVVCGASSGTHLVDLEGTSASISRTVLYDNDGLTGPILRVGAGATASVVANHVVLNTSSAGVIEVAGSATLTNNLVVGNTGSGAVVARTGGTVSASYNLFWDNAASDADLALDATNVLGADPLIGPLTPGLCNLAALIPPTNSPAIDAGDPAIVDDDGTRSDIGAYTGLNGNPLTDGDDDDLDGYAGTDDCNDLDASVHPGAYEVPCDGIDQDCDPSTSENADLDGDGVGLCDGDCNDLNPDFTELREVYLDKDLDGYGAGNPGMLCDMPNNGSFLNGDCDDNDPLTYPGAPEISGDGKDNDCDGSLVVDNDGDGAADDVDCDDHNPNRYPGAEEIPYDGKDQDCNGWDAGLVLTGGAGWQCGGCAAGSTGPTGAFWVPALLIWGVRRRTR